MISKDRLNHMLSVAKLMKKECLNNGYSNSYAEDMFILGLVHEIRAVLQMMEPMALP